MVTINISKWNTSKVISMSNIFFHCKSLSFLLDISKWDLSNVKDITIFFINSLTNVSKIEIGIIISHFLWNKRG